jgi:Transposase IS66 family
MREMTASRTSWMENQVIRASSRNPCTACGRRFRFSVSCGAAVIAGHDFRDDRVVTGPSPDELPADPRDALIREQAERLGEQERRLAAQAEQIAALEAMVADLRDRLAAAERAGSRNSGNSSMPPSADDLPGRKPPAKQCACGRTHVAARPAGVPDSALSIGPRLRALTVYLVIFQHVPVERCRQLIADVTGAVVSDGFTHSCLATAASLAADVVALIRALITAAPVAGFDETTLRSGPAGQKKYVHGAFTEQYSAFWLGARSLEAMADAGILPDFAGIVVSDRYQNYFHPRWKHLAGNQACLAHLLRDFEAAPRATRAPSGPCRPSGRCAA